MKDQASPIGKPIKNDRRFRGLIVLIMAIAFNLVYISAAIQYGSTDGSFFDKTFEKLDSRAKVGLSEKDFEAVKRQLIDYVGLKTETFSVPVTLNGQTVDFFNDKERAHMIDVRALFLLNARVLQGALVLILVMFLVGKKGFKFQKLLADSMALSGVLTVLLIGILGILATQDFTAVFIKFHELFFSNELWLLDPATDRMIVLLEEQFFSDIALHIGIYAILLAIFGTAVGIVGKRNVFVTKNRQVKT